MPNIPKTFYVTSVKATRGTIDALPFVQRETRTGIWQNSTIRSRCQHLLQFSNPLKSSRAATAVTRADAFADRAIGLTPALISALPFQMDQFPPDLGRDLFPEFKLGSSYARGAKMRPVCSRAADLCSEGKKTPYAGLESTPELKLESEPQLWTCASRPELVHRVRKRGCCPTRWPVSDYKGKFRPLNASDWPLTGISRSRGETDYSTVENAELR